MTSYEIRASVNDRRQERRFCLPVPFTMVPPVVLVSETLTVLLTFFAAAMISSRGHAPAAAVDLSISFGLPIAAIVAFLSYFRRLYDIRALRDLPRQFLEATLIGFGCWLILRVVMLSRADLQPQVGSSLAIAGLMTATVIIAHRVVWHFLIYSRGGKPRIRVQPVALLTVGGASHLHFAQDLSNLGVEVLEHFRLTRRDLARRATCGRRLRVIAETVGASPVEAIYIASDRDPSGLFDVIAGELREVSMPVRLLSRTAADLNSGFFDPIRLENIHAYELRRPVLTPLQRLMKRGVDIVGAAVALLLLAPLMITVAIAIKFDSSGPIIFRQRRLGLNGQVFSILKFRSMSVQEDGPQIRQACRNDPRITRVGRFIRASSIDELPQLFNVLIGDMSLVGPRPHAVAHDDHYGACIRGYALRRNVKPGMTGWAQVNGYRGETPTTDTMRVRVEHDIWYIRHWSIWLELRILMMTPFSLRG